MQRLLRKDINPPDGHRYTHSETRHVSRGPDYWTWMDTLILHRRANNLPVPDDMETIDEDQLCKQLPPGWCEHSEGGYDNSTHGWPRVGGQLVHDFTASL